jgi:hypothetical protein
MNYRNSLLVIFFLLFSNCDTRNLSINKEKIIFKKGFSNKGFALVYNQKLFDEGVISK